MHACSAVQTNSCKGAGCHIAAGCSRISAAEPAAVVTKCTTTASRQALHTSARLQAPYPIHKLAANMALSTQTANKSFAHCKLAASTIVPPLAA
jgi:hypothetical protein